MQTPPTASFSISDSTQRNVERTTRTKRERSLKRHMFMETCFLILGIFLTASPSALKNPVQLCAKATVAGWVGVFIVKKLHKK